ncbi:hypothetical protein AK830_g5750 [Neonectria ditissima]|uniref:C2H2-type domain-containing protein n=1 Tax=Neonectria ditissima TaxID=78410 RepID=A0A0P7BK41_9HYPO|nr:hypothetical protein AK830_g5750 [Neonectria ditissima]
MQQEQAQAQAKKIKRTSFSPWSSGIMGSGSRNAGGAAGPAASKASANSPEPPRIVSDLGEQAGQRAPGLYSGTPNKAPFASHPKIVGIQQKWEKEQQAAGSPGVVSPGAEQAGAEASAVTQKQPSPATTLSNAAAVSASQRKRPGLDTPSSEPPAKKPQATRQSLSSAPATPQADVPASSKIKSSVRAEARRFTEAEAKKHLAAMNNGATKTPPPSFLSSVAKKAASTVPKDNGTPASKKAGVSALKQVTLPAPKQTEVPLPNIPHLPKKVDSTVKNPAPASTPTAPTSKIVDLSLPKKVQLPTPPPPSMVSSKTAQLVSTGSVQNSGKSTPKVGERVVAIPMADGDRLYSLFPTPDGGSVGARGALIPSNYEMHDNPQLPYICPVRDCRRLFPSLKGLGGHFSAGHCTLTYNDNGDGTLSQVGSYINHGSKSAPGIVVSQNPLSPNAPPPADPGLSYFAARQLTSPEKKQNTRFSLGAADLDIESEVRDYLHRFLPATQKTYKREDVRYMITQPRKRELPESWIQCHQNNELDVAHYACALAFLIGEEVVGKEECKAATRSNDRRTSRLSTPCVRLPPNMHAAAQKVFSVDSSCVGCRYWSHLQRQMNRCDWSLHPKLSRSRSAEATKTEDVDMDGIESEVEETIHDTVEEVVREVRRTRSRLTSSAAVPSPTPVPVLTPPAPVVAGNEEPAQILGQLSRPALEMEEWEVAPGRMMDESSLNVAFSNSYLTSGQPVNVSEDVSFNVLVIKPGAVSHWSVEDDKLRTVSVAAGKVMVTMSGKVFRLGPNGMFIVRPGQTCKVENRLYVDSVMHCTTIADFETHVGKTAPSADTSPRQLKEQPVLRARGGGGLNDLLEVWAFVIELLLAIRRKQSSDRGNREERIKDETMNAGGPRPERSPTAPESLLEILAGDRDSGDRESLSVNPGSPPSPLPPLSNYTTNKSDQEGEVRAAPAETSIGTETEVDIKRDTAADTAEKEHAPPSETESPRPASFILDPAGELTHDKTTVDIITVPCPGGDPLKTWSRDALMGRYFGHPSMREAEGPTTNTKASSSTSTGSGSGSGSGSSDRPAPSWVRQGIRREADRARILLYEHPTATGGATTLSALADALLEELAELRAREDAAGRPVVFLGHGVGGVVVKMVLVKASRNPRFEDILRQCYGVAFFGTPHQGSSYFSMPSLASSIQGLLQLSAPLPTTITDELRVGNRLLLHLDDDFKAIATDLRVWTLYETIDSRLSGSGSGDVYFTAPLTSIKSAILGMRQETILPLQSDHASVASFGRHNVHTMRLFLRQLAALVDRADAYSRDDGHWALNLEQRVSIEVHGFFEDPVVVSGGGGQQSVDGTIRAWSTRLPLKEFLRKGPEECLADRLNEVEGVEEGRFLRNRGRTSMMDMPRSAANKNALGIDQEGAVPVSPPGSPPASPVIRPVDAAPRPRTESAPQRVPGSPLTMPPSRATSPPTRHSTPAQRASPIVRPNFDQDLMVDRLSPPARGRMGRSLSRSFSMGSHASPYEYRDFPPFSQRSRSTIDANFSEDDDEGPEASPRLPDAVVAIRKAAEERQRISETVVVDDVPVAFTKPEVEARKFVWIHLPYNNPAWVTKIFETLQVSYHRNFTQLYNLDFWATRHTRGRHSQHYAYYAKPGCYFSAPRHRSPRANSKNQSLSPSPDSSTYTCLFLPYLHFDSYKKLIKRREAILQRLRHGRARPIPEGVAKSDSLEVQVIWEFLGNDPPLNCRRTLDQYGYPSLRDTRSRDDDQMLYKLTKERGQIPGEQAWLDRQGSTGSAETGGSSSRRSKSSKMDGEQSDEKPQDDVLNGNVLMVDQLWLWAIDSHTLLSFFPKREGDAIEGPLYQQADLRDSIFNEVNVDLTRQCENALDLAALAALHAVSVLLDRASHPDLEVFRIFEEAISVLTEKLTSSLKTFRAEGFRDKATVFEPVENKARSIRARHKEEGERAEEDHRDNTSALLELRDIEDELLILLHLFERQSKVIGAMHATYSRAEMRERTANGRVFLGEALKKLGEYVHQAQEMMQRVRDTRSDYDKLLQMVQRQAQVDEVRLSRLHADLASAQSRSVMIFTTFTVIFLPLTFFTGLFGMNTREWGGDGNLPLRTIGAISLPASLALVAASLVVAWSTTARRFFRWLSRVYALAAGWLWAVVCVPAVGAVAGWMPAMPRRGRGGAEREARARDRAGLGQEASDFWERHRLERERGYHVPEKNRRSVVGAKGSWSRRAKSVVKDEKGRG